VQTDRQLACAKGIPGVTRRRSAGATHQIGVYLGHLSSVLAAGDNTKLNTVIGDFSDALQQQLTVEALCQPVGRPRPAGCLRGSRDHTGLIHDAGRPKSGAERMRQAVTRGPQRLCGWCTKPQYVSVPEQSRKQ
jgi:hypothetical protein